MLDNVADNPFILKREGNFAAAMWAYAREYARARQDGNEYIAQVCFDQMVDIHLIELLRERRMFGSLHELKHDVQSRLAEVLQEIEGHQELLHKHLETSWSKFSRPRKGRRGFSVSKRQLIHNAESRRNAMLNAELRKLSRDEEAHLEQEFEGYEKRYLRE
jgi:hypothetical protein